MLTDELPNYKDTILTILAMKVLPPPNGKKMWRVKRAISTGSVGSHTSDSSLECLNNSLKISAAGKKFVMRRPPMKRPRTKSGQPKNFVFVDLSPVRSEEDSTSVFSMASETSSASSTLILAENRSPFSMSNDSFMSASSNENEEPQKRLALYDINTAMFDENAFFGLGLTNINYSHTQPINSKPSMDQSPLEYPSYFGFPQQQQQCQIQPQYPPTEHLDNSNFAHCENQLGSPFMASTHRRTQSTSAIPRKQSARNPVQKVQRLQQWKETTPSGNEENEV